MAYNLQFVSYGALESPLDGGGMPTTFQYLLINVWTCFWALPTTGEQSFSVGNGPTTATNTFSIGHASANVLLNNGALFTGNFTFPSIAGGYADILVSVDSVGQHIQVYVNDVAATMASGAWASSGDMFHGLGWVTTTAGSSPNPPPAQGDIYVISPLAFYDLSNVANRRKFINADLTPVYIGEDGSGALGTAATIFLHVPPAQPASAFLHNYGSGSGPWTHVSGATPALDTHCVIPAGLPVGACGIATGSSVTFTWTADPADPSPVPYTLQYGPHGSSPLTWTTVSGLSSTSYTLSPVASGSSWDWQVKSNDSSGYSSVVTCVAAVASAPTGACGTSSPSMVTFNWIADPTNATPDTFTLQYKLIDTAVWTTVIVPGTTTSYTVATTPGQTYTWQIQATYGGIATAFSTVYNCTANLVFTLARQGVLGDYRNGNLYVFNPDNLTDNGVQRRWLRSWRALEQPREQTTRFSRLRVDLESGTVLTPAGTNPHCVLRWSDDGGHTWSNERIRSMGRTGETAAPVKFSRLGSTRRFSRHDRVFELSGSDLAKVAITGADVDVS